MWRAAQSAARSARQLSAGCIIRIEMPGALVQHLQDHETAN
jgi:hypothetical protein